MALKAGRNEEHIDISFFMNEAASRGVLVSLSTGGSGEAMDDAAALVTVATDASGAVPLGVLLNDMVDIDQTRQHVNWHKDEVVKGGKVSILTRGWIVTDQVNGSPSAGDVAYHADTGRFSSTQEAGAVSVGRFLSSKDADGYAKIAVNLP